MMSDDTEKKVRIALSDLGPLEDTGEVVLRANEALVIHELRRVLERQAERDIVIDEMRGVIDALAAGHVLAIDHIKKLEHVCSVLVRQQAELHERQNIISATCDAMAERISRGNEAHERLARDVADRD